ncbi:MAG: hypothetical protein Unbinned6242contig1001_12 [Prokaryotic dsDNA virus sp.]|nr:MAG: hypothetical protein Unbinned6242contig1001_12 [Prokaryotic dsDNA virus sp.]|tara:strand:+ start:19141 stop:20022 length:882 start_codon:yes stop_codon:yes gene_type:complete
MSEEETVVEETVETSSDSLLEVDSESSVEESNEPINESWKEGLKDEYKKSFDKFKDINGFAKSYNDMQRGFGDRLKVPDENASDEEWSEHYKKLGRPDKPEDYEYKRSEDMPEDVPWDESKASEMLKVCHRIGLTKKQTSKFMKEVEASAVEVWEKAQEANTSNRVEEMETTLDQIKQDLGGGYKKFLADSSWSLNHYADKDTANYIRDIAGNNYGVMKMFAKIAKDNRPKEGVESSGADTTPVPHGRNEIDAIRNDPNHKDHEAWRDRNHPKHREVNAKMNKLYAEMYPDDA